MNSEIHASAALLSGKEPLGSQWFGDRVGPRASLLGMEKWKFFTLPGLEIPPSVVQLVAIRYTDWLTLGLFTYAVSCNIGTL
jgi:hypothetical protein